MLENEKNAQAEDNEDSMDVLQKEVMQLNQSVVEIMNNLESHNNGMVNGSLEKQLRFSFEEETECDEMQKEQEYNNGMVNGSLEKQQFSFEKETECDEMQKEQE